MTTLRAVDVFTPNEFPIFTYVSRDAEQLERRLRDALSTPGEVVSVSGPSKSGKTVLIEKVVGRDNLITVTGAGINGPDEIWDRILNWMDAPISQSTTFSMGGTGNVAIGAKGEAGIPFVSKGSVEAGAEAGVSVSRSVETTRQRRGMSQVVRDIARSDFVILIDDFHYMHRDVQAEVAKQIKEAARLGVKIVTASVPHRSDDVVRANPELRGRVRAIDLAYWSFEDLCRIPDLGFPLLNLEFSRSAIEKFATEASGSPQLMQAICLQTCFEFDAREKQALMRTVNIEEYVLRRVLEETSTKTDFGSLVRNIHTGPKTRGTERKEFSLRDGSRGDVYRCVLSAIAIDPPRLSFTYGELSKRISVVSEVEQPQAASIYQACSQIGKIAEEMYPSQRVLSWDDDDSILDLSDPYLLFYLRWSGKLQSLANERDVLS